jgi:undecaprenyl diphosphate synthase
MTDNNLANLPRHLAIIMDGNGRWAKSRGLPRIAGHKKGADAVRTIVTSCRKRGIKILSLFAFSSQNWKRPRHEVTALMQLLANRLISERPTIMNNGIRLTAVGEIDRLQPELRNTLNDLIRDSAQNKDMTLCLCLSYGGREEIVDMARKVANAASSGDLRADAIDEAVVEKMMWSNEIGPVDFLIRTSGELRISNFFLWGLAYAELFFSEFYWPEFNEKALDQALDAFKNRNRRFGRI